MKNKSFTVTSTQLNTGSVIEIDVKMIITDVSEVSGTLTFLLTPLQLRITNNSGVNIFWNVIDTMDEYADYLKYPVNYELLPLKPSESVINPIVQRIYKILIKKDTVGTATGNVIIYGINYVGTNNPV